MTSLASLGVAAATPMRPADDSSGVLARYDFEAPPASRWKLPRALDEISGLATDAAGRLFAHDDEQAVIYQLDPTAQRVVKRFAFGHPAARGDFEAIAVAGERVFLTTSDGVVLEGREGKDGHAVSFVTQRTGIGRRCEVEGLAWNEGQGSLLFACKTPRVAALAGRIAVFAWSPDSPRAASSPSIQISLHAVAARLGRRDFLPSELLRDPDTGHLLLLASRAHAVVEITPAGDVVNAVRLRGAFHRQPESLAFGRDGSLLIGDEANGARATLTVYPRRR